MMWFNMSSSTISIHNHISHGKVKYNRGKTMNLGAVGDWSWNAI